MLCTGTTSSEDRDGWISELQSCIASHTNSKVEDGSSEMLTQTNKRALKFCPKLCSLVHYTQSVRFQGFDHSNATTNPAYMSSFSEKRANKLIQKSSSSLCQFTHRRLMRVYPSYHRFKSANFDPQVHWNYGCQMVALNWQTPCEEMWLYHHFFAQNGCFDHGLFF